jgi:hypothetical protein
MILRHALPILPGVTFRDRLLSTLRAIEPVLREPGVLVVGSEVPNLLEHDAASTLVVSEDVDIAVPIAAHAAVKQQLARIAAFTPAPEEPSVRLPIDPNLIEINFVGMDPDLSRAGETYVFEDPELPLLVFGNLAFLRVGRTVEVEGATVPLPAVAGLLLEKLVTDRSGEKGDRDLLVVLGLLLVASPDDLDELVQIYARLAPDLRFAIRSNLTMLSLLEPRPGMPDPRPERARIAALLERLEASEATP